MPFFQSDSLQIHYKTYGNSANEPILFIHGLGGNYHNWDMQVPIFDPQFFIILIDLRGHGKSSQSKREYSVNKFALDCINCLNHLNIRKSHILGLSLGCFVGFEIAIRFPERIRSFIGVNGTPSLKLNSWNALCSGISRLFTVLFRGTYVMGKKIGKNVFPFPDQKELRELVADEIGRNNRFNYISIILSLTRWNVESEIAYIHCPVLLISADQDYTPIQTKKNVVDQISGAKLEIIPNSHHLVNIEKPKEFNLIVLSFLKNIQNNTPIK